MQRSSIIKYVQVIIPALTVIAIFLTVVLSTGIYGGIWGGISTGNSTDLRHQNDSPYSGTIRILTTHLR